MVAFKETNSPLSENGVYIVAGHDGVLRALVDTRVATSMPQIKQMIEAIGDAVQGSLEEGVAVSLRFERGPQCRPTGASAAA